MKPKANSVRAWSHYYGLDKRQARRLRRQVARAGFTTGPVRRRVKSIHTYTDLCMEDS